MNYMSEVAKMLGVEFNEKFEIIMPFSSCYAIGMFTNDGLQIPDHNISNMISWKPYVLEHLLKGDYTIKHKPWKPTNEDCYFFVANNGCVVWKGWCDSNNDIILYKLGNCYKTRPEAEKHRDKWIAFYKSDEVLEV